jgi:Uma2 family endonuclease
VEYTEFRRGKTPQSEDTMAQTAEKLEDGHYTYADILQWDEGERYELFDGRAFMMASPTRLHQEISGAIFNKLYNFLEGKRCNVYYAPFGVRLFPKKDKSDDTYFEPDIVVVCDPSKLDDWGCNGAPDLVVEILSPSTVKHDLLYKFNKYLEAGVREYWIVDPDEKTVSVYVLEGGRFVFYEYEWETAVQASALPGFTLELKSVFTASEDSPKLSQKNKKAGGPHSSADPGLLIIHCSFFTIHFSRESLSV